MRIGQAPGIDRSNRVRVDRPATMRDPSRAPIDVVIDNLSETGALLTGEGRLPIGTLVSIGIAGAGLHLARVTRTLPTAIGIEFMLPLDPAAVARARSTDTLVSVAFPQMLNEPIAVAPPRIAPEPDARSIDPRPAGSITRPTLPGAKSPSIGLWLIGLAIVAMLIVLIAI